MNDIDRINTMLDNLIKQPNTHNVVTSYLDGGNKTSRVLGAKSLKSATNYCNMEKRKIGRELISRETGKTIVVTSVVIESIAHTGNVDINAIAVEFSRILKSWIASDDMKQAIALNKTDEYKGCCATHDFCDSNEAMIQAYCNTQKIADIDVFTDEILAVLDTVWSLAKSNDFYTN